MGRTIGEAAMKRTFNRHGHPGKLIRPGSPDIEADVVMMRRFTQEQPLEHEVSQDKVWFNIRGEELVKEAWPIPPRKGDRVVEGSQTFTVFTAEPLWAEGTVFGYRVRCSGG